jgi:hypothetical protein
MSAFRVYEQGERSRAVNPKDNLADGSQLVRFRGFSISILQTKAQADL